jgi:hypothetical protein
LQEVCVTVLHDPETPGSERRSPPAAGRVVGGLVLMAAGVAWMAHQLGWVDLDAGLILALAVLAVGIALLVHSTDANDHGGLVVMGVFLVLASLLGGSSLPATLAMGERVYEPAALADVEDRYELAAGQLTLDLTGVDVPDRTEVDVSVGFGQIVVIVSAGQALEVEGAAAAGEVNLLGQVQEGVMVSHDIAVGADGRALVLDLSVIAGEIEVREVARG